MWEDSRGLGLWVPESDKSHTLLKTKPSLQPRNVLNGRVTLSSVLPIDMQIMDGNYNSALLNPLNLLSHKALTARQWSSSCCNLAWQMRTQKSKEVFLKVTWLSDDRPSTTTLTYLCHLVCSWHDACIPGSLLLKEQVDGLGRKGWPIRSLKSLHFFVSYISWLGNRGVALDLWEPTSWLFLGQSGLDKVRNGEGTQDKHSVQEPLSQDHGHSDTAATTGELCEGGHWVTLFGQRLFNLKSKVTRICVAEPQQSYYILEQKSVEMTLGTLFHLLCWFHCPGIAEEIEGRSRFLDRIQKCWVVLEQSQEGLALLESVVS